MRSAGLPIEVLIEYVGLFHRQQLITRIEDRKKTLERLDYKIATYEQVVVEKEKELTRSED